MVLVFVLRCAEVSSRISSIAVFSVATRDNLSLLIMPPEGIVFGEPLDDWLRVGLKTGGPLLVALDMIVLLGITTIYQWQNLENVKFAIPSFLCFMNPLLEKGTPVTIPSFV